MHKSEDNPTNRYVLYQPEIGAGIYHHQLRRKTWCHFMGFYIVHLSSFVTETRRTLLGRQYLVNEN